MALTPEELALIQELKAKGMTIDQVKVEIGKRRATTDYITRPEVKPTTGFLSDTMGDITQTVSGITRELAGGVTRGAEGYAGEQNKATGLAVASGNVVGGMSRAFGEAVVGAGKVLLPESSEQAIKSTFEKTVAPLTQVPFVQQAVQDYKWLEENDPVEFRRVQAALGVMEATLDLAGLNLATSIGAPVKKGLREATDTLVEQTTRGVRGAINPPPGGSAGGPAVVGGGMAVATDVKEYAQRAAQHIQESMAEAQARRQAINQAASPQIQSAMKVNVPTDQINLITTADSATTKAMQDMVYAYEGANQEAVAKLFSQAGEEMLNTVEGKMRNIGEELGKAIDNLPNATVDMRPAQQQVIKVLEDNGIRVVREPSGRVRYQWEVNGPSAYTPEQQAYIQQAVDTMLKFDQLNSRGIYDGDRFFGNLINQFYADPKLRGLFVNVNGTDQSFLPLMRELYRSPLDTITDGGISALNKQYSQYRRLVDAANETLYNAGKDLGIPIDIGAPLQTNLRRIFSNAKSRSQFSAVLKELDRVARENGYTGPDLKSMSKFDLYVQSLYPDEAIPRGSFAGQIRAGTGVGAWFERVMKAGEPNINDQRNAVKGLLNADIPRTPDVPPSATAVPPTKSPPPTKGNQPVSSPNNTTLTPAQEAKVVKSLTKERGAVGEPSDEWLIAQAQRELRTAKGARKAELEAFIASKEKPASAGTQFGGATIFETYPATYTKAKVSISPEGKTKLSPIHNKGFKLTNFENAEGFANKPKILEDEAGNTFAYLKKPFDTLGKQDRYALSPFGYKDKKIYLTEDGGKTWFEAQPTEVSLKGGMNETPKKKVVGTPDPELRTNKEVPMKDLSGQKFTVPANTVMTPRIEGGKVYLDVNGKTYTVAKNQYENLKGQSTRAVATPFAPELEGTTKQVRTLMKEEKDEYFADTMDAKYSAYTLPGGENYTEILRTAKPSESVQSNKDALLAEIRQIAEKHGHDFDTDSITTRNSYGQSNIDALSDAIYGTSPADAQRIAELGDKLVDSSGKEIGVYTSSHFPDTPNPIYSIRINERSFKSKNDTLFSEEMQSDWMLDLRKAAEKQADFEMLTGDAKNARINQLVRDAIDGKEDLGMPVHPLLKDWQILAVKDELLEAVARGKKYYAWINGDQTSARYNLATHVENVQWYKRGAEGAAKDSFRIDIYPKSSDNRIQMFVDKNGKVAQSARPEMEGKMLDEVLGKGLADEIMKAESGNLSGEGLKFGGEWANNLYDKQKGAIVKKLIGAEVKKGDMGLRLNSTDKGRWITADEWDAWYYNSSEGVTPLEKQFLQNTKDLSVGDEVAKFFENERADSYIVAEVLGDGKFSVFPKRLMSQEEMMRYLANDTKGYELMKKKGYIGEFNDYDAYGVADQITKDLDIKRYYRQELTKTAEVIDLGADKQVQQYIELTPEVVAKIKGKAPNLKLNRDITTYGIPLLMLYFSQGGNQ